MAQTGAREETGVPDVTLLCRLVAHVTGSSQGQMLLVFPLAEPDQNGERDKCKVVP